MTWVACSKDIRQREICGLFSTYPYRYLPKLLLLWFRWFVSRWLLEFLNRVCEMRSIWAHGILRMDFDFAFI